MIVFRTFNCFWLVQKRKKIKSRLFVNYHYFFLTQIDCSFCWLQCECKFFYSSVETLSLSNQNYMKTFPQKFISLCFYFGKGESKTKIWYWIYSKIERNKMSMKFYNKIDLKMERKKPNKKLCFLASFLLICFYSSNSHNNRKLVKKCEFWSHECFKKVVRCVHTFARKIYLPFQSIVTINDL